MSCDWINETFFDAWLSLPHSLDPAFKESKSSAVWHCPQYLSIKDKTSHRTSITNQPPPATTNDVMIAR